MLVVSAASSLADPILCVFGEVEVFVSAPLCCDSSVWSAPFRRLLSGVLLTCECCASSLCVVVRGLLDALAPFPRVPRMRVWGM